MDRRGGGSGSRRYHRHQRFVYLGGDNDGTMAKDTWLELTDHPASSEDKDAITEGDSDEMPEDGDSNWYYFESDGTPAYLNAKASTMSRATAKIGGNSYSLILWRTSDGYDPYCKCFRRRDGRILRNQ